MPTAKDCKTVGGVNIDYPEQAEELVDEYLAKQELGYPLSKENYINWACAAIWEAWGFCNDTNVPDFLDRLDVASKLLTAAAEADLTAATDASPVWGEAHYWLGNARYRQTKYEAALESYTAAIAQLPEHAPSYHARGLAHRRLGEDERAISDLRRVLTLTQDPNLLAGAQAQLDELEEN